MSSPLRGSPLTPPPFVERKRIGDVLVSQGRLTNEQLDAAVLRATAQKIRLEDLLIHERLINDVDLAQALAAQHDVPFRDLTTFEPSAEASGKLPEKVVKRFLILPAEMRDGKLVVCVYNPIDVEMLDLVERILKTPILLNISPRQQLVSAIERTYQKGNTVAHIVEHLHQQEVVRQGNVRPSVSAIPGAGAASSPAKAAPPVSVEALVSRFLEQAIREQASDIHLDPAEKFCRVRMRIDGILREMHQYPLEIHAPVVSRIKVLAELDISERRNSQDGRFQFKHSGHEVDLRVSTLPTIRGEKVVMRLLNKRSQNRSLSEVGLSDAMVSQVQALMDRPHGIVLLTGPTGSGKTTTLYSMLNLINGVERNIITVEDPVELTFEIINQVQVNERAGVTFPTVLRNILRQDPDVLMIGEIRDTETADIAVRAAMTGHLVLSTLHTNDAVSTIARLVDMEIEPFLLSSAVLAVIAQRLVRRLCTHCKLERPITAAERESLGSGTVPANAKIGTPVGCGECHQSGYRGRIPVFEMMNVDDTVRHFINARGSEMEITAHLRSQGFRSLREDGAAKVLAGLTSIDEVLKVTR